MWTWLITGWIHIAIGFVFGWLVFKRPELIEKAIAWVRAKTGI